MRKVKRSVLVQYDEMYTMRLHDIIEEQDLKIIRVPGGWMYTQSGSNNSTSVFVPFSDEFVPVPPPVREPK